MKDRKKMDLCNGTTRCAIHLFILWMHKLFVMNKHEMKFQEQIDLFFVCVGGTLVQ